MNDLYHLREYVFVCPLENTRTQEVFPLYISKEYNVGPFGGWYKPGRFLFVTPDEYKPVLAEEPATAYVGLGFNVELYYLQMRKYIQQGKNLRN